MRIDPGSIIHWDFIWVQGELTLGDQNRIEPNPIHAPVGMIYL